MVLIKPVLLIFTDGYSIDIEVKESVESAVSVMAEAYSSYIPDEQCYEGMSYLADMDAIVYTGDGVYIWKIYET